MRVLRLVLLSAVLGPALLRAQDVMKPSPDEVKPSVSAAPQPRVPPPIVTSMQKPVQVPPAGVVRAGTPVTLRLAKRIAVKQAKPGDTAYFVLREDLWQGDLLLAKRGTPVDATVVDASTAKWASRGSKLAIEVKGVKLLNGEVLPLRGVPAYKGGLGSTADAATDQALYPALPGSVNPCTLCEFVFIPVALGSLLTPGTNKDVDSGTSATAWTDGDAHLNLRSLRAFQPVSDTSQGLVTIVRAKGWNHKRNLYCNGVPLAYFPYDRKLKLELEPGWYRFAINPDEAALQIYVRPGAHARLLTDADRVYAINNLENAGGLPKEREDELSHFQTAEMLEPDNRYRTTCQPLPVEQGEDDGKKK